MYEQEDIVSLMEEPPGGENHGFSTVSYVDDDGGVRVTKAPLAPTFARLGRGGYGVVSGGSGGLIAHRGVVADEEYVDVDVLQQKVEAGLGFTYEQIRSVYRSGPLSDTQRQLRDKIDSRLLALSRSGGNMVALAKALGWNVREGVNGAGEISDTMTRALARARQAEGS